jgi:predicted cupin superfamily sugar epimerase
MDSNLNDKVDYYVKTLGLESHPEGGYYSRTYESNMLIPKGVLPQGFGGDRYVSSAIYFLLKGNQYAAFHRIKSDELWHYYDGCGLCIYMIHPDGRGEKLLLGNQLEKGFRFQQVVPAGVWFASKPVNDNDFALSGCTVSPGFNFEDFEMGEASHLKSTYPQHKQWIDELSIRK